MTDWAMQHPWMTLFLLWALIEALTPRKKCKCEETKA